MFHQPKDVTVNSHMFAVLDFSNRGRFWEKQTCDTKRNIFTTIREMSSVRFVTKGGTLCAVCHAVNVGIHLMAPYYLAFMIIKLDCTVVSFHSTCSNVTSAYTLNYSHEL